MDVLEERRKKREEKGKDLPTPPPFGFFLSRPRMEIFY